MLIRLITVAQHPLVGQLVQYAEFLDDAAVAVLGIVNYL